MDAKGIGNNTPSSQFPLHILPKRPMSSPLEVSQKKFLGLFRNNNWLRHNLEAPGNALSHAHYLRSVYGTGNAGPTRSVTVQ